jgi:O-acetyl-ADP-ribose deacetylase (regulator of RNase III)
VWYGGEHGERELLASCYRSCFALARSYGLRTLAFPAISCDVYRFPLDLAVEIAIREAAAELRKDDAIERVIFACFDETVHASYRRTAQQLSLEGIGLPLSCKPRWMSALA